MIRLVDLDRARLFRLFVATGMKIGNQIIHLGFLQNVSEGRHLMTALKDLDAYLGFVQQAAHPGEIWTLGPTIVADGVAVLTTVVYKNSCSSALGSGQRE
jgi:hypothetical protein